jgi:hydrogenase maturation protease
LLLDAVNWGAGPGGIAFFPIHTVPWQGVSTHGMSLRLFAEVLAARTGCWVALVGVQPKCTRIGAPLSSEVAESLDCVAGYLMNTTARRGSPGDRP